MLLQERDTAAFNPYSLVAAECGVDIQRVLSVSSLLDDGNTIPFIARYRKEATGNLDEVQISAVSERLTYYKDLEDRRATILKSIKEQEKLTPELERKIQSCRTKTGLEDLYLPFKPKKRTRAMIAREKGLEPLAVTIMEQGDVAPETLAAAYVNSGKGVESISDALKGANDIMAEQIAETADIRRMVRNELQLNGMLVSEAVKSKTKEPTKFEQYYEFSEALAEIPSHRYLAIRRGAKEGILRHRISVNDEILLKKIEAFLEIRMSSPSVPMIQAAVQDAYQRLLLPGVEVEVFVETKMKADREAVDVFARNLRNLLMASPLGEKKVLGIDPGIRTGCKCVIVDETGQFLEYQTIFPGIDKQRDFQAQVDILSMIKKHEPDAVAIGNGTAGRETEQFVRQTLSKTPMKEMPIVMVNESGASIYSASDIAREEFPDLDLTIRGSISIARRLQDPLSELVKIDPKSIGVGQYQHDVYQPLLQRKLEEVIESCVNQVGVELNTAGFFLLSRVSGIGPVMAKKIVAHRNQHGAFRSRKELLKVAGLGQKTFQQAAGFLRIRGAEHPLDSSAVHPERYPVVEQMAKDLKTDLAELIRNEALVKRIDVKNYLTDDLGTFTLQDIVSELQKPGRDPRSKFEPIQFRDDVQTINDLMDGMELEGIVTNVTAFGAFVDIGVHQDGLVHISELANHFVRDPHDVVQPGTRLNVRVLSVDTDRKRIALSARTGGKAEAAPKQSEPKQRRTGPARRPTGSFNNNPFAGL